MAKVMITTDEGEIVEQFDLKDYGLDANRSLTTMAQASLTQDVMEAVERARKMEDAAGPKVINLENYRKGGKR